MEALAAKFADSKETKEKFAKLQLSPALSPIGLTDKERRAPMGSFATPSSASPHFAHIKVQRTASLNQGSQNPLLPKGSGNRLQPGYLAQSTDMRRTASHNNAFSSGLGMPLSANGGGFEHSNPGFGIAVNNSHNSSTAGGSSSHLTPFSLSQLTRSSRQPSLNPSDPSAINQHEQGSPIQAPLQSSLSDRHNHPLQHTWHVELFARYFNWIEKPHRMENSANYHLFKDGIKPMWEDPANANGGRWIVTLLNKNPELLDRCWIELAYALVGEQLDAGDDICGAAFVIPKFYRAEQKQTDWQFGKRLIQMLDLTKEKISLEFQITTDSRSSGLPRSYITLESIRKELAQDTPPVDMALQTSEADTTPSLSVDSASVTPASVTIPSPITPYSSGLGIDKVKDTSLNRESHPTIGTSGLLISVEGSEGIF
ncbi:hypothetical protein BGX26_008121 [Mortierella sp. AD094]|nr:hypothetical protein BGX26_008121 [Mortierella sp. AD094]